MRSRIFISDLNDDACSNERPRYEISVTKSLNDEWKAVGVKASYETPMGEFVGMMCSRCRELAVEDVKQSIRIDWQQNHFGVGEPEIVMVSA